MLYARAALRARATLPIPRTLTSTLPRALPSLFVRLKSDDARSGRPNYGRKIVNPMMQPALSFNELQYDPKKAFRTSSAPRKDDKPSSKDEAQEEDIAEFSRDASPSKNAAPKVRPTLPLHTQPKPIEKEEAEFSPEQEEFDGPKSAQANTVSQAQPGPQEPAPVKKGQAEFSTEQEEFDGPKSAEANITPESQQKEASEQPEQPKIELPDLRQGLPSTFSEEFLKQAETQPAETQRPTEDKAHHELDITEEHTRTAGGTGRGRGGSGEDDLPKSAYETSIDKRRNRFASYMYIFFAAAGLIGAVYLGRNWETEEEERAHPDTPSGWDLKLFWNRIKARTSTSLGYYTEPTFPKLLPVIDPPPPYTLVISLEDLMIHSDWTRQHGWRTAKRPGLDYFLRYLSQYYEIVLFTTMPMASADQILRKLDPYHFIMWPLFREATRYEHGEYIKDLSYLNRPLSKVILLDTKSVHAKNQPENAIILPPWKGDPQDKELVGYIPFLEYIATMQIGDVREAIKSFDGKHIPTEYARRENLLREEFNKELAAKKSGKSSFNIGSLISGALGMKPQGGMAMDDGKSVAEGLAEGKMLQDQIRERGMRNYEAMEKEIREKGDMWLKEEKEFEAKMQADQMKSMKTNFFGVFGAPKQPEGESSERSSDAGPKAA